MKRWWRSLLSWLGKNPHVAVHCFRKVPTSEQMVAQLNALDVSIRQLQIAESHAAQRILMHEADLDSKPGGLEQIESDLTLNQLDTELAQVKQRLAVEVGRRSRHLRRWCELIFALPAVESSAT